MSCVRPLAGYDIRFTAEYRSKYIRHIRGIMLAVGIKGKNDGCTATLRFGKTRVNRAVISLLSGVIQNDSPCFLGFLSSCVN